MRHSLVADGVGSVATIALIETGKKLIIVQTSHITTKYFTSFTVPRIVPVGIRTAGVYRKFGEYREFVK